VYPSEDGETLKPLVEVDGVMVSVTRIVLAVAPGAETVTVAEYAPAARPLAAMLAVTVPVLVPEAGDRVNHAAVSSAVQARVPPPLLEIVNVMGAGLVPPAMLEKVRLLRLS
jgi:hypothetical protein